MGLDEPGIICLLLQVFDHQTVEGFRAFGGEGPVQEFVQLAYAGTAIDQVGAILL